MKKIKVLMIGPARDVKGGITSVVDNYYEYGLDKIVDLKYIETINDKGKISKFISEKKGYMEFKKYIDEYDIVHIHMASRRSTFRKCKYIQMAKKKEKKIIVHVHGAEFKKFFEKCNSKQQEYIKETLNLSNVIIALSEEWKEYLKNLVDEEKIRVVYNAIMIPEDFEKNLNTKKILFLGRIGQRKGIYDLLDVIEELVRKFPDVKLYVGGDGEIKKFKQIVSEKNIESNVTYVGWICGKEKEKLLRNCSIYVLPSYNEGMPMSLIEGMVYKNVAISTDVGGIPKVINNMENGILIKPGDKEKLLNSLNNVLNDENLRRKLSSSARNTVEVKFDISKNIQEVVEIYKGL